MNIKRVVAVLIVSLLHAGSLGAKEIAGVKLDNEARISPDNLALVLNGAGIREKFFFDIYVAGLYLPKKSNSVSEILTMPGANRIVMHFLHDEVSQEKLVAAWNEGFDANQSKADMQNLRTRLNQFNGFFETVHAGDVIIMDYIPNVGTTISVKGTNKGMIKGKDFNRALLAVWLGKEPADNDLKKALLGM